MFIDIAFDFRSDSKNKDPDSYSPALRRYHKYLWSKELPTGGTLILDEQLNNTTSVGEFSFSSDSIIHTYSRWASYQEIIRQIDPLTIKDFLDKANTIGGKLIFPRNKVDGKPTINGARGLNRQISDRIDLTLECIRRYYLGIHSPLFDCLTRYGSFFKLFGSFRGYIEFFLLDDLINSDDSIEFFHPFEEFGKSVLPATPEEYNEYRENCLQFVNLRNRRIDLFYNRL